MSLWMNADGQVIVDEYGRPIDCDHCPCRSIGCRTISNSELFTDTLTVTIPVGWTFESPTSGAITLTSPLVVTCSIAAWDAMWTAPDQLTYSNAISYFNGFVSAFPMTSDTTLSDGTCIQVQIQYESPVEDEYGSNCWWVMTIYAYDQYGNTYDYDQDHIAVIPLGLVLPEDPRYDNWHLSFYDYHDNSALAIAVT